MIHIIGDIDTEQYRNFLEQLAEENLKSNYYVDIILNSPGGEALSAIAIHDTIKIDKREFRVTVVGSCQSAAVLILAAGDHRRMTRNSWVMVHEDSGDYEGLSTSQVEKMAKEQRMFENQWNRIMAKDTGTLVSDWERLHKAETYLTPEECKALNLIQEIV